MLKAALMQSILKITLLSVALFVPVAAEAALPRPDLKLAMGFVKSNLAKGGTPNFEKPTQKFDPDLFWWVNPNEKVGPNGN